MVGSFVKAQVVFPKLHLSWPLMDSHGLSWQDLISSSPPGFTVGSQCSVSADTVSSGAGRSTLKLKHQYKAVKLSSGLRP